MMAALASKTGKVGFVGGMDIPLIRKFQCGYEQGAKYANPKVEVIANMTGTTPAAWNDPTRGGELAKAQFAKGVDVVFAAAGGTGVGVYQAAKDAGKLAIGVDSNQNHLQPGTMLTSMVKRVDVAVYNAAQEAASRASPRSGLKEGGVDYALDQHNAKLVSADMKAKVDAAKADIIAGKIKVADYMADNACKFECCVSRCSAVPAPRRHRPVARGGDARHPTSASAPCTPTATSTSRVPRRHGARHRRRERRRQEHADVDPVRLLPGRQRRRSRSTASRCASAARTTRSRWASAWCTSTSCWSRPSPRSTTSCSAPSRDWRLPARARAGARASSRR